MSGESCANCGHDWSDHGEDGGHCTYGRGGPAEFICCCPEFYRLVDGAAIPLHDLNGGGSK